jgi:hypothetical protein
MKLRLYLKSPHTIERLANEINTVAFPGFARTLRDGLNRGGGEYFSFVSEHTEVLLVHNDIDHPDVFVPSHAAFRFYCYLWAGLDCVLETAHSSLRNNGSECTLERDDHKSR